MMLPYRKANRTADLIDLHSRKDIVAEPEAARLNQKRPQDTAPGAEVAVIEPRSISIDAIVTNGKFILIFRSIQSRLLTSCNY